MKKNNGYRYIFWFVAAVAVLGIQKQAWPAVLQVGPGWPGSPYSTIQAAVDAASDGDELWVAQGTYALSETIDIGKAVSLYGGFIGMETQRNQRSTNAALTVIDGSNSVRCLLVYSTIAIDGFTITHGNTNGDASNGAAIWNGKSELNYPNAVLGYLTLTNCIISGNSSGKHGGLYNDWGYLTISDCTFSNNSCVNKGGAITNYGHDMTIARCTFTGNSANNGGAITFPNTSGTPGATNHTTITDCVFSNNTSLQDGGAFLADGNCSFIRCSFTGNSSTRYGIIAMRGDTGFSASFTNCVFAGNTTKYGGAICVNGSSGPLGAITAVNCTFAGNNLLTGGKGGAFYTMKPSSDAGTTFAITNSILWGNRGSAIDRSGATQPLPSVSYSDLDQPGYAGTFENSINQDPKFIGSGDYHLQAGSPCIDAGTGSGAPANDIAGTARPQAAGYDIGAYEYVPQSTTTTSAAVSTSTIIPPESTTTTASSDPTTTTSSEGETTTTMIACSTTTVTPTVKFGKIICPDIADVSIDEWKPDENLNYYDRIIMATNHNIHHGIARGLFRFDIPQDLEAADVNKAEVCLSACHHCGGGDGGQAGFYALNAPFNESADTWNSLQGGSWDDSINSQVQLPGGTDWNTAINGNPPADVKCFDISNVIQNNLEKARGNGILLRFLDETQVPSTWENVASRETTDPLDFAPYMVIHTRLCPAETALSGDPASLDLLRSFRDTILSRTAVGRYLARLYYRKSDVFSELLSRHPLLRNQSVFLLKILLPHIRDLLGGAVRS